MGIRDSGLRFLAVLLVLVGMAVASCSSVPSKKEQEAAKARAEEKARNKEAQLHYQMGVSYLTDGKCKEALIELLKAEDMSAPSPEIYNAIGLAYFCLGEGQKAEDAYKIAIDIRPDYSDAHTNLAALYLAQHKWMKAITESDAALHNRFYLNPERAYNNKAYALEMLGKDKEALENYNKAIRYNPKFTRAYENLIAFFLRKNRIKDAKEVLSNAEAAGLSSAGLTYFKASLAMIYGDRARGLKLFREVIKKYPNTPWARKAATYLSTLGK
jgi:type IV pilus assembly protein PilF